MKPTWGGQEAGGALHDRHATLPSGDGGHTREAATSAQGELANKPQGTGGLRLGVLKP